MSIFYLNIQSNTQTHIEFEDLTQKRSLHKSAENGVRGKLSKKRFAVLNYIRMVQIECLSCLTCNRETKLLRLADMNSGNIQLREKFQNLETNNAEFIG